MMITIIVEFVHTQINRAYTKSFILAQQDTTENTYTLFGLYIARKIFSCRPMKISLNDNDGS